MSDFMIQLIIAVVGIFVILYFVSLYLDKKNKPKRDEHQMFILISTILISRYKESYNKISVYSKEVMCDIHYVFSLFYPEKYNYLKNEFFNIKSSDRKKKLKSEFSKIYQEIINDSPDIDEYLPDRELLRRSLMSLNTETKVYEKNGESDKRWHQNLSLFWSIIYVAVVEKLF